MTDTSLTRRIAEQSEKTSPAERRVTDWLSRNRETALHASATAIARAAQTSDATVIRTARKLGYSGLDELRRALAKELRQQLTLADRLANDLSQSRPDAPLALVTSALRMSLEAIDGISTEEIAQVTGLLDRAPQIHVFGIGPSGFVAGYFATQLTRLGRPARAISRTGLQFADDLVGLRPGDAVVALAYDLPYPEVRALFDRVENLGLGSVLITSTGPHLPDLRAGLTLRVPRGRPQGMGLHAGTMALLEGLLMALSAQDPKATAEALEELNVARQALSGDGMDL